MFVGRVLLHPHILTPTRTLHTQHTKHIKGLYFTLQVSDAPGFINEKEAQQVESYVLQVQQNWPQEWGQFDPSQVARGARHLTHRLLLLFPTPHRLCAFVRLCSSVKSELRLALRPKSWVGAAALRLTCRCDVPSCAGVHSAHPPAQG